MGVGGGGSPILFLSYSASIVFWGPEGGWGRGGERDSLELFSHVHCLARDRGGGTIFNRLLTYTVSLMSGGGGGGGLAHSCFPSYTASLVSWGWGGGADGG